MKKMMLKPLLIFCLLTPMSVMAEESLEDTRIMAAQVRQMTEMVHEIADLQDQADLAYENDGIERVGQLGKIIVEAEMLRESADLSESSDEVNEAWLEVSNLRAMACKIVKGENAAECK